MNINTHTVHIVIRTYIRDTYGPHKYLGLLKYSKGRVQRSCTRVGLRPAVNRIWLWGFRTQKYPTARISSWRRTSFLWWVQCLVGGRRHECVMLEQYSQIQCNLISKYASRLVHTPGYS